MNARKIAAEFAAYTWYEESRAGEHSRTESRRFARDNWAAFLPGRVREVQRHWIH